MKAKALKITFESLDDFQARSRKALQSAVQKGTESIQEKDVFIWSSVETYQKFMSDQKYTILAAIVKFQPKSVYRLGKILNRAQQNVAHDCELLARHGCIRFEEGKEARRTKAPRPAFDYNTILIHLPGRLTYKVGLSEAA